MEECQRTYDSGLLERISSLPRTGKQLPSPAEQSRMRHYATYFRAGIGTRGSPVPSRRASAPTLAKSRPKDYSLSLGRTSWDARGSRVPGRNQVLSSLESYLGYGVESLLPSGWKFCGGRMAQFASELHPNCVPRKLRVFCGVGVFFFFFFFLILTFLKSFNSCDHFFSGIAIIWIRRGLTKGSFRFSAVWIFFTFDVS